MSCVEADELSKSYRSLIAVDHLSLTVDVGEVFGILGPNGAGKTTTLRILACLFQPSGGSAKVCGHDITTEPMKVRQIVGILTENPCVYERLTAYENMDFFARAYGVSDPAVRERSIRELLDLFGLWERKDERVGIFSKGMKQKLAIARTLVHGPQVLFMDEPTSGLDPESSKAIRDLIEHLSRLEKRSILLSTHRLEDAERLCGRVMIIKRGKSISCGTPQDLRAKISGRPVIEIGLKKMSQRIVEVVRDMDQVSAVSVDDQRATMTVTVDDLASDVPEIVKKVVYAGG